MDCVGQSTNLSFGPMHLASSSVPANTNRFLTIVGTIFDRIWRTGLGFPSIFEEGAAFIARGRRVVAVRGDIARLRGHLLARQRVGAPRVRV